MFAGCRLRLYAECATLYVTDCALCTWCCPFLLMAQIREKKEAGKSRQRFWEMAGSKMASITGAEGWGGRRD
jgi:pre-mRNA-splicing factor ATP-dependent RNA helicase DHX38/PRP16